MIWGPYSVPSTSSRRMYCRLSGSEAPAVAAQTGGQASIELAARSWQASEILLPPALRLLKPALRLLKPVLMAPRSVPVAEE